MQVFGKLIETRHGNFNAGDPLPPEWTGKETIRQLKEQFGEDAVIDKKSASDSFVSFGDRLTAMETSLAEIKDALGIGKKQKKQEKLRAKAERKSGVDTGAQEPGDEQASPEPAPGGQTGAASAEQ